MVVGQEFCGAVQVRCSHPKASQEVLGVVVPRLPPALHSSIVHTGSQQPWGCLSPLLGFTETVQVLQVTPNPTLQRAPSHRHHSPSPQREGAKGLGAVPHLPSLLPTLAQLLPCPPAPQLSMPTPEPPSFREEHSKGLPGLSPAVPAAASTTCSRLLVY